MKQTSELLKLTFKSFGKLSCEQNIRNFTASICRPTAIVFV